MRKSLIEDKKREKEVEHKKKEVWIINYTQYQSWDLYFILFFLVWTGVWTQGILFATMESPNPDVLRSPCAPAIPAPST
jgi:hypothetical protein